MSLPAPSSTPSAPPPPGYPPRRGNGCLWGCLGLVVLLCLPMILAAGYGSWFLWTGYKRNPVLRVVGELVRHDGTARMVLGDNIVITGVQGGVFSWIQGISQSATLVELEGSRGQGVLAVTSHNEAGGPKLDSAILTGPDGGRHDLLRGVTIRAPDGSI